MPRVTAPAELKIIELSVTLAFIVVAVLPAAIVTLSSNVTSPAVLAWVIPDEVASVLLKVVPPGDKIVSPAPNPVPIAKTLPTLALNVARPEVSSVRLELSMSPSTNAFTTSVLPTPPVVFKVTFVAPAMKTWSESSDPNMTELAASNLRSKVPEMKLSNVTLPLKVLPTLPAAVVTLSLKDTTPAEPDCTMPEFVATVL